MLGTGALGQLALGQENTNRLAVIGATASVNARGAATIAASADVSASFVAVTRGAVSAAIAIPGRATAVAHAMSPFGFSIPSRGTVIANGQIFTGIVFRATGLGVKVSTSALPTLTNVGAGKLPGFPSYIPQPDYEAKPAKPFRPIWDIQREQERRKGEPAPAVEQGPPPLPPASIFGAPEVTVNITSLPDYGALVPGEWHEIGARAKAALDQRDMDDALAVLEQIADEALLAALQAAATRKQ